GEILRGRRVRREHGGADRREHDRREQHRASDEARRRDRAAPEPGRSRYSARLPARYPAHRAAPLVGRSLGSMSAESSCAESVTTTTSTAQYSATPCTTGKSRVDIDWKSSVPSPLMPNTFSTTR